MFISICTLVVFLYQTDLIREQQYMSVYPHLALENHGTHSPNYRYVLQNKGIGPALIKSVQVKTKQGKTYDDIVSYVEASLNQKGGSTFSYSYSNLFSGQLVPANSHIDIIRINDSTMHIADQLFQILHKDGLDIRIEYESIYGECWEMANHPGAPKKK
ncbi:MAG: hypothetical protein Tsb004_12740 [Allomuricauda sp.]